MIDTLKKSGVVIFSGFFLAVSIGIIVWIAQDEERRLAEREAAALEQARMETAAEESQDEGSPEKVANKEDAARAFRDIDTLLTALSVDDLPGED